MKAASLASPQLSRTFPDKPTLMSLSDADLSEIIVLGKDAKAELNRRNATSRLDRVNAKWREQIGMEPLPGYDGFVLTLAWQAANGLKQSKKQARAVPVLLLRPELFAHLIGSHPAVERILRLILNWEGDVVPEQLREWIGPRGKNKAEAEYEKVDNKLRELSQRPEQAPACLRPTLEALRDAYAV